MMPEGHKHARRQRARRIPTRCIACGYDLASLSDDALCPECGCAVRESRSGSRLASADPTHIRRLRLGAALLVVVGLCFLPDEAVYRAWHAVGARIASLPSFPTSRWSCDADPRTYDLRFDDGHVLRVAPNNGLSFSVTHGFPDRSSVTTFVDEDGAASWVASPHDPQVNQSGSAPCAAPPERSGFAPLAFGRSLWSRMTQRFDDEYSSKLIIGSNRFEIEAKHDHSLVVLLWPQHGQPSIYRVDNTGLVARLAAAPPTPSWRGPYHGLTRLIFWTGAVVSMTASALRLVAFWLLTRRDHSGRTSRPQRFRWLVRVGILLATLGALALHLYPVFSTRAPTEMGAVVWVVRSLSLVLAWAWLGRLFARLGDHRWRAIALAFAVLSPAFDSTSWLAYLWDRAVGAAPGLQWTMVTVRHVGLGVAALVLVCAAIRLRALLRQHAASASAALQPG